MLPVSLAQHIKQELSFYVGKTVDIFSIAAVGGGSINRCYRIDTSAQQKFFCKLNDVNRLPGLFSKEREGLQLLGNQKLIRVPHVLSCTTHESYQVLLLEWIEQGSRTGKFWQHFGEQLAQLHGQSWKDDGKDCFGLDHDNYMGALPQSNTKNTRWTDFFVRERLQPQVKMATDKGLLTASQVSSFERLYPKLGMFFDDNQSSLLHGDLWSGNFLCDVKEQPVLIDPAVYYGHRSMDLAMTTLFGGFDKIFYESYAHYLPLPANYTQQWEICNLYPLLIHVNLFGGSYMHDVQSILRSYA